MDRPALDNLLDYTGWTWEKIGAVLAPLGPEIITREMPSSPWPALWDCLRHISFGYAVWAERLDGRPAEELDSTPPDWEALDDYHKRAHSRLRAYLDGIDDVTLMTPREIETLQGTRSYKPADVIMNILWHDRGHHGDINTLLYQHGIPDDDWPWIEYRAFAGSKRGYLD